MEAGGIENGPKCCCWCNSKRNPGSHHGQQPIWTFYVFLAIKCMATTSRKRRAAEKNSRKGAFSPADQCFTTSFCAHQSSISKPKPPTTASDGDFAALPQGKPASHCATVSMLAVLEGTHNEPSFIITIKTTTTGYEEEALQTCCSAFHTQTRSKQTKKLQNSNPVSSCWEFSAWPAPASRSSSRCPSSATTP